ncbi:MAG: NUDIX domain-containing protein [Bacteroidales bacterium]|nr:NUDIX domain-containing protein [Bacteroidales bacterium]
MMVDEEGNPTGGCPRPLVHNGSKWLHAVVHLHVVSGGRLLLQLRPKTKKIQGGKWDTAVGGHVSAGEKLETALARETAEEIGLTQFDAKLVGRYVWRSEVESEYVFQFVTQSSGPFNPQNVGEVDELKFWTHAELESALGKGVLTPNLENELKAGLLDTLKNY